MWQGEVLRYMLSLRVTLGLLQRIDGRGGMNGGGVVTNTRLTAK